MASICFRDVSAKMSKSRTQLHHWHRKPLGSPWAATMLMAISIVDALCTWGYVVAFSIFIDFPENWMNIADMICINFPCSLAPKMHLKFRSSQPCMSLFNGLKVSKVYHQQLPSTYPLPVQHLFQLLNEWRSREERETESGNMLIKRPTFRHRSRNSDVSWM